MERILITSSHCGQCMQAKVTLRSKSIDYTMIDAESKEGEVLINKYSLRSIPALITDGVVYRNLGAIIAYVKTFK